MVVRDEPSWRQIAHMRAVIGEKRNDGRPTRSIRPEQLGEDLAQVGVGLANAGLIEGLVVADRFGGAASLHHPDQEGM